MRQRIYFLLLLLLASSLSWSSVEAEKKKRDEMIDEQVMNLMKRLDTLEQREQFALLSKVDEQRLELLGVLMQHLGTSHSQEVRAAAAYLIGRHRLSEGVAALVEHIDLDVTLPPMKGPEPLWERYPAMEALITIGKPSVRACIELMAAEDNRTRRDLATKVIRYVEGPEVGAFILQKAVDAESDPSRKARLEGALTQLRQLPR